MKEICLILLIFISYLCNGQNSVYIKSEGKVIDDFVPKNWKIIRMEKGDLNKDGCDDFAIVIQELNPNNISINKGLGVDTLDSNPRILLILFMDSLTKQYSLIEKSFTFILSHTSPTMDDPFDGLRISNGILQIGFHYWFSAGSWLQTSLEYKFRYQRNQFYLIGAEFDEINRGNQDRVKRSFNFSTKKMIEIKTKIEVGTDNKQFEKNDITNYELDIKELKTLKSLKQPLQWEVLKNVTI